jgi:hypothetical protein
MEGRFVLTKNAFRINISSFDEESIRDEIFEFFALSGSAQE